MQHGWLEPGADWCVHLSVPVSDFRADAHLVSGADDRREVVDRVLRLARNHLVERFGDDPFDGDELVLRDDHMVEHEVAWAVPFVRRSRLGHPTLHNVLFVGPVIIPKGTRFAPSLTSSFFARVEDYIARSVPVSAAHGLARTKTLWTARELLSA